MGLGLLCYPGIVYAQACHSSGMGGLFTTVVFLPVVVGVYLTVFCMVLCLIAWVWSGLVREISVLRAGGMRLSLDSVIHKLCAMSVFRRLAYLTCFALNMLFGCAAFFSGYLQGAAWRMGTQPHAVACIQLSAYRSTYADSGAWDTALLLAFDAFFRAVFVFSIVPLSEHSVVEKMSVKVNSELVNLGFTSHHRKNLTLRGVLLNLAGCMLLLIIFFLYAVLLVL